MLNVRSPSGYAFKYSASTPASSAAAISVGMRFMTRSNQPVNPQTVMSAELTMKAPTASGMVNCPEAAAVAEVRAVAIDLAIAASKRLLAEKVQGEVAADLISKGVDEVKARFS